MAAPTIVAGTLQVDATTAATTLTVTLPTHAAGDILIVVAGHNSATAATLTCSTSGWTKIGGTALANWSTGYFWKRATSSSETSPVISSTQVNTTVGLCATPFVVSGCISSGTPYEGASINGTPTSSTSVTSATCTTTDVDRLVVAFGNVTDNTSRSTSTPPTGWTETTFQTSTVGNDFTIVTMQRTEAAATTVAAAVIEPLVTAELWQVMTLAFIPNTALTITGTAALATWSMVAPVGQAAAQGTAGLETWTTPAPSPRMDAQGVAGLETWTVPNPVPKAAASGTAALETWTGGTHQQLTTPGAHTAGLETWTTPAPTLSEVMAGTAGLETWTVPAPTLTERATGVAALATWTSPTPTLTEIMAASAGLATWTQPPANFGNAPPSAVAGLVTWTQPQVTLAEIMAHSTGVATWTQPQVVPRAAAQAVAALASWVQTVHTVGGAALVAIFDGWKYWRRRRRM